MEQPYQPIACDIHDVLLAKASLRQPCELTVRLPDGQHALLNGLIEDVYTRAGAEYLVLRNGPTFRLDQILALDGKPLV